MDMNRRSFLERLGLAAAGLMAPLPTGRAAPAVDTFLKMGRPPDNLATAAFHYGEMVWTANGASGEAAYDLANFMECHGDFKACAAEHQAEVIANRKEVVEWFKGLQTSGTPKEYARAACKCLDAGFDRVDALCEMPKAELKHRYRELKAQEDHQRMPRIRTKLSFIAKPDGEDSLLKIKAKAKGFVYRWVEPITQRRVARSLQEPDDSGPER